MRTKHTTWSVYIYVIFITTLLITSMSFLSKFVFWNLEIYNNIKSYFSLYGFQLWFNEELIVNYYDNPTNTKYIDNRAFIDDQSITRYKEQIEYDIEAGWVYELSLTSFDEEYNHYLDSLKFIDVYRNPIGVEPCNLKISLLKWEKNDVWTLWNNKIFLHASENREVVSATLNQTWSILSILFSTWALWVQPSNILFQNINNISGGNRNYTVSLSPTLSTTQKYIFQLKNEAVTNVWWDYFGTDEIVVRSNELWYNNRYRIKDSFASLDKKRFEYKLIITSEMACKFLLEWYDSQFKKIQLPDNYLAGQYTPDTFETLYQSFTILKELKIWNINLSNYLYKIY